MSESVSPGSGHMQELELWSKEFVIVVARVETVDRHVSGCRGAEIGLMALCACCGEVGDERHRAAWSEKYRGSPAVEVWGGRLLQWIDVRISTVFPPLGKGGHGYAFEGTIDA